MASSGACIAQPDLSLPCCGSFVGGHLAANCHVQIDHLGARGRIALQLNFKSKNFSRLKLGESGPNHWFARGFDLNLMGIKSKTAALIVFFDAVFIAIYAEQ